MNDDQNRADSAISQSPREKAANEPPLRAQVPAKASAAPTQILAPGAFRLATHTTNGVTTT